MIDVLRDRRVWLVSGAVVVGVAVGLIVSFVGSGTRRAEATVLVSSKSGPSQVVPFLPDLKTLATSSLLAGNIRSTLRLSESEESVRRRLHGSIRPQTQVIAISATGSDARSTQQLAQEAAVVFALLVGERFRTTTPPLRASVLDPAHVLGGPERHVLRNALIGVVLGLAIGTAVAVLMGGGVSAVPAQPPPREAPDLGRREALLERRLKTVTARERELASSAASLATRDRELAKREREVEERAAAAAEVVMAPEPARAPEPELVVAAEHEPEPEPELKPEVVAAPPPEPATAGKGAWNINELERLVAANHGADRTQLDEWRTYLFFLRDHAAIDGDLPPQFDSLISEVFGGLLDSR